MALTQIHIFRIPTETPWTDAASPAGQTWSRILALAERSPGFQHLYWGRSVEHPHIVHLHLVKSHRDHHTAFLTSPLYAQLLDLLRLLTPHPPVLRHATLAPFTPGPFPLAAPVTGTAIYLASDPALWDAAWRLWTHIVPRVDGCRGVVGGYVEEPVRGAAKGYLVYVGWESVAKHDAFHHTEQFEREGIILGLGNEGWAEYGHVQFLGERRAGAAPRL